MKKISQQELDYELGEKYAEQSGHYGKLAAEHLFRAQWKYQEPEWYDHRLHFLDPEHHNTDFWLMSAANVIQVLPLGGSLLDLCSGDGWYDRWFYALRANVMAIDNNQEAHDFAIKHHSHPRIKYIRTDIRRHGLFADNEWDVVLIRGAIEHFNPFEQTSIIGSAYVAVKNGGYFCGDTPAKRGDAMLQAHEHEWTNEDEMRDVLMHQPWTHTETWSLDSETVLHDNDIGKRTTLFWRCRK